MQKLLLLILITVTIVSCKKETIECAGNCASITVSGRAYDATTNEGFSNIPITVD